MKKIYLDNAAATPTDPKVVKAMADAAKFFGNSSAFNDVGRQAKSLLEKSRKTVADFLHARADEIIFTSSGSEANNLALIGYLSGKKGKVLTTPIEHPSVLQSLKSLPGINLDFLTVNKDGLMDIKELEIKLTKDVLLVSIMYANNEIGTIEPVAKAGRLIRSKKIIFHVDACQAAGYLDMNVQNLNADLLTFNGSKIYGPRGIAALYIKRGINLKPLIYGGDQERGLRAGTENLSAIVGLAKSIELIDAKESKKISSLRDYLINKIQKEIPEAILVGPIGEGRLANNINICVTKLTSEVLLLELDKYYISAGSGSACTSHSVEPSHVLKAIGVPRSHINGALRFSLGRETNKSDLDNLVKTLKKVISTLNKRYE